MNNSRIFDIIISLLPVPPVDKAALLQAFDSEEELIAQSMGDIEKLLNHQLKNFWDIDLICAEAERLDNVCRKRSIKRVSLLCNDYPPLLREIYDPPAVIFYRGQLPDPEKSLLGIVGTRRPSPEGAVCAYSIARGAGRAGISVISGLALGIDAMAHRGGLAGGVPGYSVLGSGVDEIYPSTNRGLAKKILDSGGALISEYPPGVRPAKWNFPARNRIISAFSRSVLIVEAPQKSGALITAGFALEQGKDLWVASCGAEQRGSALYDKRGTVKLAEDGADIICKAADIFEKWDIKPVPQTEEKERNPVSSMADLLKIEL
jgi:DNA processing protein